MNFRPNPIVNSLLCCNNFCFPMYNNHYITGKGIFIFSNLACIENTLSSATCSIKNCCNTLSNGYLPKHV